MKAQTRTRGRGRKLDQVVPPTPEQMRRATFDVQDTHDKLPGGKQVTIGKAYCRKPMIDTLYQQGLFSAAEYKALKHYRHHADIADRSVTRDSLNRTIRTGNGDGPTRTLVNAIEVVRDCERAAGSLMPILRAVVVYDRSLSDWAMEQSGSVEQCRDRKGKRVCTIEPRKKALEIARLDIVMAAKRVEAEGSGSVSN